MAEMKFTTNELLEAQAHVWNLMLGYLKSMCLKSAVELGIADVLKKHGKPMELSDLMSALSISPSRTDPFRRFMGTLTHMDLFAEKPGHEGKYYLTPSSHILLVSVETMNVTPFVRLCLDPTVTDPTHIIGPWFKSPKETPFELYFGKNPWDLADEKPDFKKILDEGLASDSRIVCDVVMMMCSQVFRGLKSLVDVGGGTGTMARAIARAFPETKCTVLDLPHVVDSLKEDSVVEYVGGDMFVSVPPANAVLLKWILRDWNDEECVKILQRCKEAIPAREVGGKIIIIDMVVGTTSDKHAHTMETQLLFDILLMSCIPKKERNEREWRDIILAAGFKDCKITPFLGLRSVIELYP